MEEHALFRLSEWAERELIEKKEEKPEEKKEEKNEERAEEKAVPQDVRDAIMAKVTDESEKRRERRKASKEKKEMEGNCGELVWTFPEFFDCGGDNVTFVIPAGWQSFFMKVFHTFKATHACEGV